MYVVMCMYVCAQERPPILQYLLTTMQRPLPAKDHSVPIHISVLVPNGLPLPGGLLPPTKESSSQLVIETSLWEQRQRNLFIQAEREEISLFRQHNCKIYSLGVE